MPQPAQPKHALPVITYDDGINIFLNGEEIEVRHMPAAHTDGDSFVFFATNKVLRTGDIFVRYGFRFIDVNAGGSVQGMIAACDKALAEFPADTKVIPGHGALATMDDLRDYDKVLKDTTAVVQKALDEHKTMAQMKDEKILGPWQKLSGNFVNSDAFLTEIYNSLTRVSKVSMGLKPAPTRDVPLRRGQTGCRRYSLRPTRRTKSANRGSPRIGSKNGCTLTNWSILDCSL
jgi:cyclase